MREEIVKEVRLIKTKIKVFGLRQWRWDVISQKPIIGTNSGVSDSRYHLDTKFGYSRTRLGAWIKIARHVGAEYR